MIPRARPLILSSAGHPQEDTQTATGRMCHPARMIREERRVMALGAGLAVSLTLVFLHPHERGFQVMALSSAALFLTAVTSRIS